METNLKLLGQVVWDIAFVLWQHSYSMLLYLGSILRLSAVTSYFTELLNIPVTGWRNGTNSNHDPFPTSLSCALRWASMFDKIMQLMLLLLRLIHLKVFLNRKWFQEDHLGGFMGPNKDANLCWSCSCFILYWCYLSWAGFYSPISSSYCRVISLMQTSLWLDSSWQYGTAVTVPMTCNLIFDQLHSDNIVVSWGKENWPWTEEWIFKVGHWG